MSLELISDASCLSDGDGCENGSTSKHVRFNLRSKTPSSMPSIQLHFADSFPRDNLELTLEDETDNGDISPQPLPCIHSEALDLSISDEPQLSRDLEALSLDIPQINSVRNLQEEVIKLASRVHMAKNSSDSVSDAMQTVLRKRQKETELLGGDGLKVCVNFTPDDRLFSCLPPLDDINVEDLVREEKDRLARQRQSVLAEICRVHPPKQEILPEPNLLKFFDSRRHIFQSARLDAPRIPIRQPTRQSLNTPNHLEAVRLDYCLCTELPYYL
nr:hypothetical transcript [Hymenolepis microstoma]CUU97933.1 hypothetical transcript [Hymenolepis microstoma]